jgi:hypothetical protein
MLLFDTWVHYDTHVIPQGNYVIAFGPGYGPRGRDRLPRHLRPRRQGGGQPPATR